MDIATFPSGRFAQPDADLVAALAGSPFGRTQPGRSRPLILLIEDDAAIARMYQIGLALEGFDLTIAEDGISGLEFMHEYKPDLVLLDLGLPRLDGLQLLRTVQGDRELKAKIVVLSNFAEQVTIDASIEGGALEYVLKATVTPRELAQILARHLL